MVNISKKRICADEALAAYMALGPSRSLTQLFKRYRAQTGVVPPPRNRRHWNGSSLPFECDAPRPKLTIEKQFLLRHRDTGTRTEQHWTDDMTKKSKTTKSTRPAEPILEREARAAYIAMSGKRSAARVRESFVKQGYKTPSQRTFDKWRARYEWVRLAREHDETVANGVAAEIAKEATAQAITRAAQLDTLATETLNMAIDGLAKIDVDTLKVTDIRSLVEVSVSTTKMYELLEGRAIAHTDNLTRAKMDKIGPAH